MVVPMQCQQANGQQRPGSREEALFGKGLRSGTLSLRPGNATIMAASVIITGIMDQPAICITHLRAHR